MKVKVTHMRTVAKSWNVSDVKCTFDAEMNVLNNQKLMDVYALRMLYIHPST